MGGLYLIRMKVPYLLFIWIENTKPDPDPDPEVATSARFYLMCCLLIAKTGSVIWLLASYIIQKKIHKNTHNAATSLAWTCMYVRAGISIPDACAMCVMYVHWRVCLALLRCMEGQWGCRLPRAPCVMAVVVYALVRSLFVVVIILHKTKQGNGLRVLELHSAGQQTELPLRHKHTGYGIGCISYVT